MPDQFAQAVPASPEEGSPGRVEDAELVRRIRSDPGDRDAFGRILEKYWRFVVAWSLPRVGNAAEAEDVAQEAFIRAFRAIDRLQDPERFLGWLLRIARNLATDHVRRRRDEEPLDRIGDDGRLPGAAGECREDIGERIDRDDEMRAVLRVLKELPDRYRSVVLLRYFEGLSGSRIAEMLGEPEGTVRNRLFRALAKIRRSLAPGREPAAGSRGRALGTSEPA